MVRVRGKASLMILTLAFTIIPMAIVARPVVKASDSVRFYVEDPADGDHIYAGVAPIIPPIPNLRVQVLIESPYSWMGTPLGIIGYQVSVRVDPTVLEVMGIEPSDDVFWSDGFSDGILEMYAAMVGGSTLPAAEMIDKTCGTMWGFANALVGVDVTVVGGAGGNAFYGGDVAGLCTITLKTKNETEPSLIDLMGQGISTEQLVQGIDVSCQYAIATVVDPGPPVKYETHWVEPDDGYYVAVVDTMYLDCSEGYDPASPLYTDWHELAPIHSEWWTLESWIDNSGDPDGVLDESDQVDMSCTEGPDKGAYNRYYVEWVNPSPVAGDGLADLIVKYKEAIPQPPVASFTYSPSLPLVNQPVTFNASASTPNGGTITGYEWDFDYDGTTFDVDATDAVANYTYPVVGDYTVALNVTDDEGLWDTLFKNVTVHALPAASFTYSPSEPSVGDPVTFNASTSEDPDGTIASYTWNFGDGLASTETDPITQHVYTLDANYTVTLNVTDNDGLTNTTTATVTVSRAKQGVLDVEMDVGTIHFPGEIAEFYVLTSFMGKPVDAEINATLYHEGTPPKDLSGSVESKAKGLYRVPHTITPDAPDGTYVLVVNASYFAARGTSFKSFLVSLTLTSQNATVAEIKDEIATIIIPNLGTIKANLTLIDATLDSIEDTTATINSTIGELETSVDTINATIIEINGTVTTINSTLGSIKGDIGDLKGAITHINGTLVEIQTSIGLIETNVTAINAKLTAINETVGIVKTDLMGLIEVELDKINATIADVKDGFLTINSTLGDIQLGLDDVKEDVSLKLVSVLGDIEEGLANVTAAITDAEGNILLELGQVEVRMEDINTTVTHIEGNVVTVKTDIGTIHGTITSIKGDIATIETDIGIIEAAPTSFTIIAETLEDWTDMTTSSITTPAGTFDILVLTNSTLEGPITFSDNTLTIVISGQRGTIGTLGVQIPKQPLAGIGSSIDELAVTINEKPVSFTYREELETYMLVIIYTHSMHTIKIHLTRSQLPLPLWILLAVAFATAVSAIVAILFTKKLLKKPIKP